MELGTLVTAQYSSGWTGSVQTLLAIAPRVVRTVMRSRRKVDVTGLSDRDIAELMTFEVAQEIATVSTTASRL